LARIFCSNLDSPKPYTIIALKQNDRRDNDAKIKKKVIKMVHEVKNIKTKLPRLEINKNLGRQAVKIMIVGLLWACGVPFSTMLWVYLGCKILGLVIRFIGMLISIFCTLFFIFILILILSLIIFYL
jgi:hypothetical protein